MKLIASAGKRFGYLIVLADRGRDERGTAWWLCRCDCGCERAIRGADVQHGKVRSCGRCKFVTLMSVASKGTHGEGGVNDYTKEWVAWRAMLQRCYYERTPVYKNYGGRGISVCDRWRHDYQAFLADMGRAPTRAHTLDRFPNTDGNYEPGNCRWATRKEQARNTRATKWVELDGKRVSLAEACESRGVGYSLAASRIRSGWSLEMALSMPACPHGSGPYRKQARLP